MALSMEFLWKRDKQSILALNIVGESVLSVHDKIEAQRYREPILLKHELKYPVSAVHADGPQSTNGLGGGPTLVGMLGCCPLVVRRALPGLMQRGWPYFGFASWVVTWGVVT